MVNFHDSIPESFIPWINEQHCFWVATAPLSADGHVNVSPKGMTGTFKLLGPNACFYQDLSGSGVETISHLRENKRITIMFSAFKGSPRILRLWGTGVVHELGTPRYEELIPFSDRLPGSRAAIEVQVHKVGSPTVKLIDTPATDPLAHLKPTPAYPLPEGTVPEKSLRKYWAVKNIRSIDGVPGLHLGRAYAGLPMTRDKVKDNTRFHQPVEVVGGQATKAGVMEIPARGSWAPIILAFALGLAASQFVELVHHAYSLALGL
ncbi:unnamed protein product [Rhizoctonia solani]|uniref:Pyridoxamine 5'-phosphate oxidase N-terminal domain-containing protein n=1 Tax=Rhizoctonia solani TaxID=456999 RepID=A0A8H3BA04_9AGAM|nr:unnamed protein product [Rhizoctonia solani]